MKSQVKNKILFALIVLMLSGCTSHKNVIQSVTMKRALLKDVKTGQERIYDCPNDQNMQAVLIWLDAGQEVDIVATDYENKLVLTPDNCRFHYDADYVRRCRQELELAKKKAEMQLEYSK